MVAKNAGEKPAEEVAEKVLPPLVRAKMIGKPVYSLIFECDTPEAKVESKAKILAMLAEIKAIGDSVRNDGGKAFDEATKAFREQYEKDTKPFREAYEKACEPFAHLKGDVKSIGTFYESLTDTLEQNRDDCGDLPRFSNLGRPPKS